MPASGDATTSQTPGVRPLCRGDVERLANALAQAFDADPNLIYLLPGGGKRAEVLPLFFEAAIRAGQQYGQVHTTEDVAGGAVWLRPGERLTLWRMVRVGLSAMPLPLKLGWPAVRRSLTLSEQVDRMHGELAPDAHWYLMALGVAPGRQGRGIGSALIQPVLERADSERLPCYLETFNQTNVSFYARHGFEVSGQSQVPGGGPPFWGMRREPSGQGSASRGL